MRKFLGLLSLACVTAALVLAIKTLFLSNFWFGIIYLVLIADSCLIIVLSFCTKCPIKRNCAHVFPGLITRLFKDRQPGVYTKTEMILLIVGLVLILGFPQFWLIKKWTAFLFFWILNGIGLFIILKNICVCCGNKFCPLNRTMKIN